MDYVYFLWNLSMFLLWLIIVAVIVTNIAVDYVVDSMFDD